MGQAALEGIHLGNLCGRTYPSKVYLGNLCGGGDPSQVYLGNLCGRRYPPKEYLGNVKYLGILRNTWVCAYTYPVRLFLWTVVQDTYKR
jgi:hypothetical protein